MSKREEEAPPSGLDPSARERKEMKRRKRREEVG